MHEVAVIEEIVESVREEIKKYPGAKVESVSLRIGKLRQFVPEIMKFCYDVAGKGTELEGSTLLLTEIPVQIFCRRCEMTTELDEYDFHCPDCQSVDIQVIAGNELILDSIKLITQNSTMPTNVGEE